MDKYEKKYDSAVSETETDIRKLTDLLLKVGTQQFLETLSPYITGGEILFEYSCAVTPQIRQTGNRLSGNAGTAYASLLA